MPGGEPRRAGRPRPLPRRPPAAVTGDRLALRELSLRKRLDELEQRLRAFGAPIAGAFRPGAAPGRAPETAEGIPPHADLLAWWGWHDGAEVVSPVPATGPGIYLCAENVLVGPWHVLSLAESMRMRLALRQDLDSLGAAHLVPATWVPLLTTDGAGELCLDAGAPGAAPLHIRDEGYLGGEPPQFASLAELVELAIRAFDEGLVRLDPQDGRAPWIDDAALATDLRRLIIW